MEFMERHNIYDKIKEEIKGLLKDIKNNMLFFKLAKDNEILNQEELNKYMNEAKNTERMRFVKENNKKKE